MGLREYLAERRAKKRSENRINRRAKRLYRGNKPQGPTPIERTIQRVGDRGIRLGQRLYSETQQRKGEGKKIVVNRLKKLIGEDSQEAVRTLFRDPNAKTTRTRIKMPPPGSTKIKTIKRRRRG